MDARDDFPAYSLFSVDESGNRATQEKSRSFMPLFQKNFLSLEEAKFPSQGKVPHQPDY
ncbi:MAG TPA: hypothetical protein H9814_01830 [Candidatus Bacteroides merdigallinarum]|uniref:Uncharacterized protein n=1 Tax=Candidatus Bacteroides merdigallinarum TaxID=2838473 RepID=A0A9D2E7P2_9BACE|nr:hypothetical protein [Candidatus Bacteroides merdigallinarum]